MAPFTNIAATRTNLRRLCVIRTIILASLALAIGLLIQSDSQFSAAVHLIATLIFFALATGFSWWRSYWPLPIADMEFFTHLLLDLIIFTVILYFSGGATNPLVSYYLVPISIAAATLPRHLIWAITLLSLAAYTLLMQTFIPLQILSPGAHQHAETLPHYWFDLHLLGMWLNFAVSAGIITYFVVGMAANARRQEAQIQRHLEDERRTEQLLDIASLAAGTAHELGTPLNSIQIVADELHDQLEGNDQLRLQLATLNHAVDQCRSTLHKLVSTADTNATREWRTLPVAEHMRQLLDLWRLTRPKTDFRCQMRGSEKTVAPLHASMDQTLTNLVNNAADAAPERVDIDIEWTASQLTVKIRDFGPGLDNATLEQAGKAFITTKRHGLGIGLFLSKANLDRLGGTIMLGNAIGGGTLAEVTLPLTLVEN